MAGGIAHEVRTPLTISSSAAQFLMEDDIEPGFRRECAQKVHEGIQRASVIIENLLRFARPANTADRARLDIVPVVREAAAVVASQAHVDNIQILTHLPGESIEVLGIGSLLEQVLVNLLLNAMRAMPEGGTVDITAGRQPGEAVLRVADSGHGIAPEDLGRVFDPFYTRAPSGKGTGLGLSLCYSIVKQHMGSISVESEVNKGSVFTVRLPLL
jgi:signal transduction histidine kinase